MTEERTEVQTTETTEVTVTSETAAAPVIDWDAAPAYQETVSETTVTETVVDYPVGATYAPRGRWDFTDGQRIVIGLLVWLNIIVLTLGVLIVTGQFNA